VDRLSRDRIVASQEGRGRDQPVAPQRGAGRVMRDSRSPPDGRIDPARNESLLTFSSQSYQAVGLELQRPTYHPHKLVRCSSNWFIRPSNSFRERSELSGSTLVKSATTSLVCLATSERISFASVDTDCSSQPKG